jgi:lipopolysaccharide transport system ATP-binding protein
MKPAIRVSGLSKEYRVGLRKAAGYRTLRETLTEAVAAPFRRLRGRSEPKPAGIFYALKDVSFDVRPGEAVGIIGRNGAGKSTLLKVLSRITEPTDGRVEVRGRVGSLLEVGTGFHPELTGRENVYLNGSILGMSRREIDRKFDEIVDFSGVETFLDTPVKRYSSGMTVRLAFAVAAHLDPEILVIDEVLAVGDLAFQRKCMGKMEDVTRQGRTVLFVSHNVGAIERLCKTCILLESGRLVLRGACQRVLSQYVESVAANEAQPLNQRTDREGNGIARFTAMRIRDHLGRETTQVKSGEACTIELDYVCSQPIDDLLVAIGCVHPTQGALFQLNSRFVQASLAGRPPGGRLICRVPSLPINHGLYQLNVSLTTTKETDLFDQVRAAVMLTVTEGDFFGTGVVPHPAVGSTLIRHAWDEVPA